LVIRLGLIIMIMAYNFNLLLLIYQLFNNFQNENIIINYINIHIGIHEIIG